MSEKILLDNIKSPRDIKNLNDSEIKQLCSQIREKIIGTVADNGGHLASNLGVVELTVALHRVFNSPEDQFVWDVGHQCYTHKLLTGRYDMFSSLRKENGMSGFTNPSESEHDIFYSGHSSTSISAAYGLAMAKKIRGEKGTVVAIIGDGAMTGGEAYEGINNAARNADNLIIIINDNQMSISDNKSQLGQFLAKVRSTSHYYTNKKRVERALLHIPLVGKPIRDFIYKSKYTLKGILFHSTFFDDLGYAYLGPVDGHNEKLLEETLRAAKSRNHAVIIHVDTLKGKGYNYAEIFPTKFHGIGEFDVETGESLHSSKGFSFHFGKVLCSLAEKDSRICAVTAAMPSGTGLDEFSQRYSSRFFDAGIAEQHAVTFASGLAKNGMLPVFAVYSTFLQRAYDQLIHDVALQKLKVVFAIDRAGFVGSDGETHQGVFDVPMFNTLPGFTIFAPASYAELERMLNDALYKVEGACAVRYPRGSEPELPTDYKDNGLDYSIYAHSEENTKLLVTYGRVFAQACRAAAEMKKQGIGVTVLKLNKIKPINPEALEFAKNFEKVWFFEEGICSGGAGEQFEVDLQRVKFKGEYILKGIEETFVKPAEVDRQLEVFGLDCNSITEQLGKNSEQ